jgi:dTDP-4-dehydrorhamnose reductase
MKILVTGSNGQLGSDIRDLASKYNDFEFIFTDYEELDITSKVDLSSFFDTNNFYYVINCAAYTAVDLAEKEKDKAFLINAEAVKNLVENCKKNNTKLITISTDYVFDGNAKAPYLESHKTDPQSAYGESKEKGEKYALEYENSLLIRTSWLYSSYGNNFVKTMLRLGTERDELGIVSDQIGAPTYSADLAKAILEIILYSQSNKFVSGIYHFSNKGEISWFNFTKKIFEINNIDCKLKAITTADYPTPAKRPSYSVFDLNKIVDIYKIKINFWEDSLNECLVKLRNNK